MTATKTKTEKKTGDKPTHFLKIKSEQFGKPINFTLAALWEDKQKDYMGVNLNELKLVPSKDKHSDQSFNVMLDTKIHGQDAEVQVGHVSKGDFKLNLGDLVLFPNNYEEKKPTNNNKPRP